MPVETLRPHDSRLPGGPFTPAVSFRLLNKGPDYFRRRVIPGPRLSAVERLEADKAKYVKSQQVALTRQAPVKPPIIRKPLLSPGMMMQCRVSTPPARRFPRRPGDAEQGGGMGGVGGRRGPPLNLEILSNLINNVCESPLSSPSSASSPASSASPDPSPSSSSSPDPSSSASPSSPSSGAKSIGSSLSAERQRNGHLPASSCPASSCPSSSPLPPPGQVPPEPPARCPPPVPARGLRPGPPAPYSAPNSVTVRRVDVRPQLEGRKPLRPPLLPKPQPQPQTQHQPLPQPQPQHQPLPQPLPQPQPKHQPLIKPRQIAQPQAPPPPPPLSHPSGQAPPPYPPPSPRLPPASPAFTRLSSSSSRGSCLHPSLHRSKSDLSDRYSRATADLERFFNYCGLDPRDLGDGEGGLGGPGGRLTRAASDIVSVSKMRSVSTPSSEYGERRGVEEEGEEEEEEEGLLRTNERVPYGISVIERNARVIKWLYGIRQARDSAPPARDSTPETRDSTPETRDSAPQDRDCTGISNV